MKKFMRSMFGLGVASLFLGIVSSSNGALIYSENFNSYTAGIALTNQGNWAQTGASAVTPILVSNSSGNNRAAIGTSGQDVYSGLASLFTGSAGTSLYVGMTLNVTAAQSAGDYFFHLSNPLATSTGFFDRLFARSSGAGYQLGFAESSGAGITTNWGTTVLSFATDVRVVLAQDFVAGANNDVYNLYVNPTDLVVVGNNTAYLTKTSPITAGETNIFAAINLRQGGAALSSTLQIDDIQLSQTFSDVSAVPEPSTVMLVGLGVVGLLTIRRRRSQ